MFKGLHLHRNSTIPSASLNSNPNPTDPWIYELEGMGNGITASTAVQMTTMASITCSALIGTAGIDEMTVATDEYASSQPTYRQL